MGVLQQLNERLERFWPTASLRSYMLAMVLLATLPIAVSASLHAFAAVRSDQDRIESELSRSASALAQSVEREVRSSLDGLGVLARSEPLQHGRIAALGPLLHAQARGDWDSLFLLDRDGSVVLDTAGRSGDARAPQAMREIRRQVLQGRTVMSGPSEGQPSAGQSVAVAVPIRRDGQVQYILGARLRAQVWQELSGGATRPRGAGAALFNERDRLIASSATRPPLRPKLPSASAEVMEGRGAGFDGPAVYAAWRTIPLTGWRVQVALPAGPIDAAHRRALVGAVSTSGASLLLGLLLAALLARRVSRPLRRLAAGGVQRLPARIAVREIALVRDALGLARAQDSAADAALHAKVQEFETLFESSPIGLAFAHDPACSVISQNAAMDALIGPRGSQGAGTVRVLHQGRVLAPGEQPLQRAAFRGETVTGQELEIEMDGLPSRFVIANAVPLPGREGRPRGGITAVVDITQRKQIEQRLIAADRQLRETQRQMELAQEAGRVGFFHYQFGIDRLAWTPGQCKLFGVEQLAAGTLRDWFERIAPDDRERIEREFWTACALRREQQTLEYRVLTADQRVRWLSSRVLLQYDGDGRASQLVGVTVEVTDQVEADLSRAQLTERAVAARHEAEAASRAKDEFLTMLGHELRNPLGAISAAIDVLDAAGEGSETAAEARTIIARQTRNLAHMMNDLLDVGRVIAGKIVLAREAVNLAAIMRRVDETLAITGEARTHPLELTLGDAWVDGDAVRIEQIAANLLTNAIRYTPIGRSIQVRTGVQDGTAVLEVQDSGLGIPAALLPRVFDLFVQGERPLDRRAGGLGIGLTLVRRLVQLHGGSVAVESSDRGTRFTVHLPAIAAPTATEQETLPSSRRRKVLVVEDNEDVMAALRAKLELDGHTVSTATDGLQGLDRLLKLRPEVSIVDIGLPGLTGFELARHARAAGYAGRMIAMSGYGAERDAREALVAGFDAYLVKPVDSHQLRASLSAD